MKFYTSVIQHRSLLLVSGYEDGKRFYKKVKYRPYLFAQTNKDTKYRTIHGQPVEKLTFNSIWEAKDFIKTYENVDNFKIYGMTRFQYPYIHDIFRGSKPDKSLINLCIIDIEVSMKGGPPDLDTADREITAITCQYPGKNITFTFGCKDYDIGDRKDLMYMKCKNEQELLLRFLKLWTSDIYRPDVITGWNIEFFDIPYIVRRLIRVFNEDIAKKLSPFGVLTTKTMEYRGRDIECYIPNGVNILDYFHLYQKFTYSEQEQHTLDHIAYVELGERKVNWKEEYDSLDDLYDRNYKLFIDYNLHDCELVKRLDDKMKLLDLVYDFAYDAEINYIDTLSAVRTSDVIIHNYLIDQCMVIPHVKFEGNNDSPIGAFVKEPIIGMHDWVMSVDLTSLYPHILQGTNISPDTLVGLKYPNISIEDYLNGKANVLDKMDCALAANGALYRKDRQGFLGALMEQLFAKRKEYKDKMLDLQDRKEKEHTAKYDNDITSFDNLQHAKKIQLNSFYGALLNNFFRWNNVILGESVTLTGQLTILWAEKHMNAYLNKVLGTTDADYIIAVDTDSLYINMKEIVTRSGLTDKNEIHDYLANFSKEHFDPLFKSMYQELADYLNSYKQACHMKLEVIADRTIFVGKKRYILNVLSSEGVRYEKPKMKMKGIEAVRSSTPEFVRKSIKDSLNIIMTQDVDTLREYVRDLKEKFEEQPFDVIAFPRSVKGLTKYWDKYTTFAKGTPIHVRGALIYNLLMEKKGLQEKYPPIYDKSKIKFCYLLMPNPCHSNIIAVPDYLPKELGLDKYIDYDKQFDKAFVAPIQTILDAIGWKLKKENTIDRFCQ